MKAQLDRENPITGSLIFDLRSSHAGYELNRMCYSLNDAENRARYKKDEEAYLAEWDLSDEIKDLIRKRNWRGLTELGGNVYFLMKLGFVVGHGLYQMGAIMRGETLEEFYETRAGKGAR